MTTHLNSAGPTTRPRRTAGLVRACVAACVLALAATQGFRAHAADAVTEWTLEADRLGGGGANWRTLAIMHMAMHDAANAVRPRYARWAPPAPGEPPAADALLEAALAGAAAQVLVDLHPEARDEVSALFQSAIRRFPPSPALRSGVVLGAAIGQAAVNRRANDGYATVRPFRVGDAPGVWRPTPPSNATSNTTDAVPFLFATRSWGGERPPPAPGSPAFLRDAEDVRAAGAADSPSRTIWQTEAATYWAYQSSQRGFVLLGVKLVEADSKGDLIEHARALSLLTAAMADSAILAWSEKERFMSWRPITAIQAGGPGLRADPSWQPLIETPSHPEYPSGHTSDCFTGAGMLTALFGIGAEPVTYVAQSALQTGAGFSGMGQHAQAGGLTAVNRRFPTMRAAAEECAQSRIWAGAHFRSANIESQRLADAIVHRALAEARPIGP